MPEAPLVVVLLGSARVPMTKVSRETPVTKRPQRAAANREDAYMLSKKHPLWTFLDSLGAHAGIARTQRASPHAQSVAPLGVVLID